MEVIRVPAFIALVVLAFVWLYHLVMRDRL